MIRFLKRIKGGVENRIILLSEWIKIKRWDSMVYEHWKDRATKLSKELGNRELSPAQIRQLKEFWDNYLPIDFIEHKFYLNACDNFDVRYIPSSVHYTKIDKYFNDWERARIIDNKTDYQRLFPGVNQPESILTRSNGFWYQANHIINESKIADIVHSNTPCFIKIATESEGGKGVYYIDKDNSVSYINQVLDQIKGDVIIQKAIVQSKELSLLNSSSVNTIRIMTLLNLDGSVSLCSACLRMGVAGARVDNASSGGVVAGIDNNGYLKKYAYKPTGERFLKHPTSGIVFEKFKVPSFDKCKELVSSLAPNYPYFRLVSWDIALNQNNDPVLIEANLCSGELDFHQLNNGPIFGDQTEKILLEVFKKGK